MGVLLGIGLGVLVGVPTSNSSNNPRGSSNSRHGVGRMVIGKLLLGILTAKGVATSNLVVITNLERVIIATVKGTSKDTVHTWLMVSSGQQPVQRDLRIWKRASLDQPLRSHMASRSFSI